MRPFFLLAGFAALGCWPQATLAQPTPGGVGIGTTTPNAAAALDITASGKGVLIPRLDSATRVAIASPPTGLLVFQTGTASPRTRTGFYYYAGGTWLYLPDKTSSGDNLGNHTATQNLNLGANQLVGNGGSQGLSISTNGNVGVGTSTPRANLEVAGNALVRNTVNLNANEGDLATYPDLLFGAPGTGEGLGSVRTTGGANQYGLDLYTGYSKRLSVSRTGRIGIGTDAPAAQLDLTGGANSDGSSDPAALAFGYQSGGYRHYVRTRHNSSLGAGGNDLDFYLNNSSTADGSSAPGTGNVPVLTLESYAGSPRVGIGTTSPGAALDVAGAAGTPNIALRSLGGSGTRVVTADASGNLATSATASTALESLLGLQKGTVVVGASTNNVVTVDIDLPVAYPFGTVPTIFVSPRLTAMSLEEAYTTTIRQVSSRRFEVLVRRADATTGWSQTIELNWLAIP